MGLFNDKGFCPVCGIGIHVTEQHMGFCQNCKSHWEPDGSYNTDTNEEEEENDFEPCSGCDGHPACEDFGCAIEAGIIPHPDTFL